MVPLLFARVLQLSKIAQEATVASRLNVDNEGGLCNHGGTSTMPVGGLRSLQWPVEPPDLEGIPAALDIGGAAWVAFTSLDAVVADDIPTVIHYWPNYPVPSMQPR